MSTLTKKDFVESVSTATGLDREQVRHTLQVFLEQMIHQLGHGSRIEFRDFGVFEVRQRAARTAQNPKTLQRVSVPPRKSVKFKPGRLLKDLHAHVSGPLPGPGSDGPPATASPGPSPTSPARRSA